MLNRIAIIGAGFSGITTAINLVNNCKKPIEVLLIDSNYPCVGGLAYSTFDDNFVLNVPAQNMSALPDKMNDFEQFCNEADSALIASSFVPRRIYGEYLKQKLRFAEQRAAGSLIALNEKVIFLTRNSSGYSLSCESGLNIDVHVVVLALGHFSPKPLNVLLSGKVDANACVVNNPWNISEIDSVPRDKDVLIVGSGHTAIDTLFRLESSRANRHVYLFSRHGLHPHGHRPIGEFQKNPTIQKLVQDQVIEALHCSPSVTTVTKVVKKLLADLDVNWRDVINALRPITPQIWSALPTSEKSRFMRHLLPYWDVHRHRLSPQSIKRLSTGIDEGRYTIGAYAISKIETKDTGDILVTARGRHKNLLETFKVGAVINCTGPTYDISNTGNKLVSFLFEQGILKQDEMKIGLEVANDYSVNPNYPNIYYIGPMLKAVYWEAIAVPELRVHSSKASESILKSFD